MEPDAEISCLSDYLRVIERLKEDYPIKPLLSNPTQMQFLYRGLPDKEYVLLPSVFRKQEDRLASEDADDSPKRITNKTYLTWNSEKAILRSFIQEASHYVSLPPDELLEWAEYAQHYGAPTRFLDWSSNPLAALYFACREEKNCDGKVWLLHYANYMDLAKSSFPAKLKNRPIRDIASDLISGRLEIDQEENKKFKYPILYTPYYVDARMSAQSSWFMIWGTEEKDLESLIKEPKYQMNYVECPQSERSFGENEQTKFWHCFSICADGKQSILRELDTVGINEKTLFPGLDGIGRYVEKKYHFDYNEAVSL